MAKQPEFDVAVAHKYFAAHCFNAAWDLIEKPVRTAEDDRLMMALNQASLYHWLQRPDCDNRRLSIGYWQAARIQGLLNNAAEARRFAEVCLSHSGDLEPFYLGYAYEALARAAHLAGEVEEAGACKARAKDLADAIKKPDERQMLLKDLESV